MVLKRFRADRDQQQWQAGPPPVPLQQMQLVHHAVHQLQRVIRQVADVVLQNCSGEGQSALPSAVEAGRVLRFDAPGRQAAEVKPSVGPHLTEAGSERIRTVHLNRAVQGHGESGVLQGLAHGTVLNGERHQHRLRAQCCRLTPTAGIEVCGGHQTFQKHFPQPGQALGPDQRQVGVGLAGLAARSAPFRADPIIRHPVQLRVQGLSVPFHGQPLKLAVPASGVLPALFAACRHQLEGQEQGPLRFDVFKFGQFLRLVMQPTDVFHGGLVSVPEEAFVAVGPAEFPSDPPQGSLDEIVVIHGPGGIAHHGQTGAVSLFAG